MIARLLQSSLVRFGAVAVAGLTLDLATAWCLATFAGVPLPFAAAGGICAGAVLNYWLHERWTFGRGEVSAKRGSLYTLVLLTTLVSRVGSVALLQATLLPGPRHRLPVLVIATGISFVINYLMSRYVVFRPATRPETLTP